MYVKITVVAITENLWVRFELVPGPRSLTQFWISATRNLCQNDPEIGQATMNPEINFQPEALQKQMCQHTRSYNIDTYPRFQ